MVLAGMAPVIVPATGHVIDPVIDTVFDAIDVPVIDPESGPVFIPELAPVLVPRVLVLPELDSVFGTAALVSVALSLCEPEFVPLFEMADESEPVAPLTFELGLAVPACVVPIAVAILVPVIDSEVVELRPALTPLVLVSVLEPAAALILDCKSPLVPVNAFAKVLILSLVLNVEATAALEDNGGLALEAEAALDDDLMAVLEVVVAVAAIGVRVAVLVPITIWPEESRDTRVPAMV